MGGCHSACGPRAYELEYYNEAYRHQTRQRARAKLVDESLAIGGQRLRDKHRAMRRLASGGGGRPTRLWMCEQGCCSIRWKLDYAEFQSYTFYAQVSPYVVVQDKTGRCECLICRGRSESPSVGVGGSRRGEMNALEMLRKACEARRFEADTVQELLSGAASSSPPPASSPPLLSETSATDTSTDDDDDGGRDGSL